jgi:hypothetical protein
MIRLKIIAMVQIKNESSRIDTLIELVEMTNAILTENIALIKKNIAK